MRLTLPQQDIYFEQLLFNEQPIYNIGAKIRIEGELNIEVFNKAYILLINQHDAYRTVFYKDKEAVYGKVIQEFEGQLEYLDLSNSNTTEEGALGIIEEKYLKPFKITSGSFLHRFCLIKVSKDFYYFFTVCHHIITDGWGTSLMFQRLVKNYNELLETGEVNTDYLYSYIDFVNDDEEYEKSEEFNINKDYWNEKFKNLPESLFVKKDAQNQLARSSRKTLTISRSTYNELNSLSKDFKSSTFHILFALLYIYFGRKHQNNDFVIGLPVLNRGTANFKKTVGLFMGLSLLRVELDFEDTIQGLISTIRNQLRQDYRHRRFPTGKLIKELQLFQEPERLFNITLSYEKQDYSNNFGKTKTAVIPLSHQSERVALAIYIREFDDSEDVNIDFDYNLNYFDKSSISQVTSHYENLIKAVIRTPDLKLKDLNYLSVEEERQLLTSFNYTKREFPNKTLLDFFKNQVQENSNKIAIYDNYKKLTYLELDDVSDKIAEFILNYSEGENINNIGVLLERSVTTIAVLLGILKAGKSYIPLDPTFPNVRLRYIIDHSEIKLLISDQEALGHSEITNIRVSDLLNDVQKLNGNVSNVVDSADTAYVIYTSGSTGEPKGVEIGHKALLNFLLSMQQKPGVDSEDSLFAVTTYSFDISILEFFAPLIAGASVYVVDNETLKEPEKVIQLIKDVKPSIIQATPSFYQLLFNAGWKGKKDLKVLCGGDLLSEELADQLLRGCSQLWNMYGPTETTIWSSVKEIKSKEEASNIGAPINNTEFFILDSFRKLVPVGTSGSLHIGGAGLAKGYYKAPDLNQQKFFPNPYNNEEILYNTNDLARWNSKGEVEFIGRNDSQVKIRGYRIELGEIETKLNSIPEIKQAIVVAKKKKNQDAFLVAYILKENCNYRESTCILTLENELPKYMVPYTFIEVEGFPLTPNKKVDRKVLSQQKITKSIRSLEFQKPQTELQEKLISYWKDVLQFEGDISIDDNFFSLGGHSLNAVKLVHQINNELVYSINLRTLFDFPTVASLSNHLEAIDHVEVEKIPKSVNKEYYKITPSQYEIWLASQNTNRSISYNMVAAFCIDGYVDINELNKAVYLLIIKHEILRTNYIEKSGSIYQKINDIQSIDFKISSEWSDEKDALGNIQQFINSEFNLEKDLLIKMKIIKTSENKSYLVFCTHHIIMDGWSLEVFTSEFLKYYNNSTLEKDLNVNAIEFKDYSEWHNLQLEAEGENIFWENYLNGFHFKESFVSNTRSDSDDHSGSQFRFELSKEETLKLKEFLRSQETTLHSFLIAALNILIFKFSGHKDIILGTVNSGRNSLELNNMIGMFVKTLPIRNQISEDQNFISIIKLIQDEVLQISKNQDIPYKYRKRSLFDIIVSFQNPDFSYQDNIKLKDAKLISYPIDVKYSRLPLLFNFFEMDNTVSAILTFDSEKYDEETITIIVMKFKKMINRIISKPSAKIKDLDISLDFESQTSVAIDFSF